MFNGMKKVMALITVAALSFSFCFILTPSVSAASVPKVNSVKNSNLNAVFPNTIQQSALKSKGNRPTIKRSDLNKMNQIPQNSKDSAANNNAKSTHMTTDTASDEITVYNEEVPYFNPTEYLTDTSSENYYVFSTSTDSFFALGLTSSNADYVIALYVYDASSDTFYSTGISIGASTTSQMNYMLDLPAGTYLMDVYSTGDIGDSYTLGANATNPANPSAAYEMSYLAMVLGYPGNYVYANGFLLTINGLENGTALDWSDNEYRDAVDEYNSIDQYLLSVHTLDNDFIHVSYSSELGTSDNALMITLGAGTQFYIAQDFLVNGQEAYYSNEDGFGYQTPESLDKEIKDGNYSYIIFDLNTDKTIDMIGASRHLEPYDPIVNQID